MKTPSNPWFISLRQLPLCNNLKMCIALALWGSSIKDVGPNVGHKKEVPNATNSRFSTRAWESWKKGKNYICDGIFNEFWLYMASQTLTLAIWLSYTVAVVAVVFCINQEVVVGGDEWTNGWKQILCVQVVHLWPIPWKITTYSFLGSGPKGSMTYTFTWGNFSPSSYVPPSSNPSLEA